MEEIFKQYRDSNYTVSNLGNVKNKKGKLKKFALHRGYPCITIWGGGEVMKTVKIHRMVAEVFLGASALQVNHKNGIKTDNWVENLEYVTCKQNIKHAHDNGLCNHKKGEQCYLAKLTEEEAIEILQLWKMYGLNQPQTAKEYNVTRGCIHNLISGKNWKHLAR